MERKDLVATLFLKNGEAVTNFDDVSPLGEASDIAKLYNDSGIDKIFIFDLSETIKEKEATLHKIKELNRIFEIPVYGAGNITRLSEIQALIFAGCTKVILDSSNPEFIRFTQEGVKRFGIDKLTLSLAKVDVLFKQKDLMEATFDEIIVINDEIVDAVCNLTDLPFTPLLASTSTSDYVDALNLPTVKGVGGLLLNDLKTDVMILKNELIRCGLPMNRFASTLKWEEFNHDSDGLIAVIAQDYSTSEVLTFGYMNEQAFNDTMELGKMTYYNPRTGEVDLKGEASEQFQYVKSLTVDCHKKALLAKISQIGVSCHTGNYSCFFQEIVRKDYQEKNTFKVFENLYNVIRNRKKNPKEGSYTNYLYEMGMDEILKKLGEEATQLIIESKNNDVEGIRTDITNLIYHLMVLMTEQDLRWEDITSELIQR
ncbi:MAG: bifunctional phosphoribosyl-AMP cyclohydrolase/phosphoribosyl-ATP diphosphatase HisIE [Lachnospiraceae bacterium]